MMNRIISAIVFAACIFGQLSIISRVFGKPDGVSIIETTLVVMAITVLSLVAFGSLMDVIGNDDE